MRSDTSHSGRAARRAIAIGGAMLLSVLGLTACGDDGAEDPVGGSAEAAADGAAQDTEAANDADGGSEEEGGGSEAPAGEALPADWPAQILVPEGTIVLVLELGAGYQLLVEGVDDAQAQGLIAQMVEGGMQTTGGVVPTGDGEWVAEVSDGQWSAAYAYAGGGAGLPNVALTLTPAG